MIQHCLFVCVLSYTLKSMPCRKGKHPMKSAVMMVLAIATSLSAASVTLPEQQYPSPTPLNGLTVTAPGESFTFSDPGGNIAYNVFVPGVEKFISTPSLVGPPEPFSITFSVPVDSIQFGMAEGFTVPAVQLNGVRVELFNGGALVYAGSFNLPTDPYPAEENQFNWSSAPGQQVTSMVITPVGFTPSPGYPEIFGFGNMIVDTVPGPASISGINNGAGGALSGTPTAVAPGEIVTIIGQGIGPAPLVSATVPASGTMSSNVGGTSVTFNGTPASVLYASASQTAVIVPYEVAGSASASVVLKAGTQTTAAFTIPVAASAPGLFTETQNGLGEVVALHQDGTVNSSTNAASVGNVIILFATGEGITTPAGQDGLISTSRFLHEPVLPVSMTIGGKTAQVLYAGSAQGSVEGLMEVEVVVPAGAGTGAQPVVLKVGTASSATGATISLQ